MDNNQRQFFEFLAVLFVITVVITVVIVGGFVCMNRHIDGGTAIVTAAIGLLSGFFVGRRSKSH